MMVYMQENIPYKGPMGYVRLLGYNPSKSNAIYLHPMNLQDFAVFAPKNRNGKPTKKPHTRQLQICLTMSSWWFQPISKILVEMGIFPK